MKVLLWVCGFQSRFAGPHVGAEASRQGLDVRVCGSRSHPEEILVALEEYKPDVVLCFAIRPNFRQYYDKIRATGAKLVLWYPDMTEARRDRMWRNVLDGVADALIFSILETAQRYRDLAPIVLWMPQYFDDQFCRDEFGNPPTRLDPSKTTYDLCFIGSCDPLRTRWLTELEKRYKCNFHLDGIKRGKEIRGYAMAEVYAQSRIAFNIQREAFLNPGPFVTSNRTYNAMGSGAFFINHKVEKLDLVFTEDFHCAMHDNIFDNLCRKIDFFLEHPDLRETIARHGQENVLCFHTLEQRVKEYWQVMDNLHRGVGDIIGDGAYGAWTRQV